MIPYEPFDYTGAADRIRKLLPGEPLAVVLLERAAFLLDALNRDKFESLRPQDAKAVLNGTAGFERP